jgi:hypothetical protein
MSPNRVKLSFANPDRDACRTYAIAIVKTDAEGGS